MRTAPRMEGQLLTELRSRLRAHDSRPAVQPAGSGAAITYGQLLESATGVADQLRQLVGETRAAVAIIGRPGAGLYAAVLGALLANQVPALIDAGQPPQWIERAVAAVEPTVTITCDGNRCATEPGGAGRDGRIRARDGGKSRSGGSFAPTVGYLGFTSGSRGTPRAIVGSAAGLAHFVNWQIDTFSIGPGARFGQLTSPSFDVFYRDLLTPLMAGATICVPGPQQLAGARVVDWLAEARITHLHAVPSLARYWLRAAVRSRMPELAATFFAGEHLHGALVNQWRSVTGTHQRVVNLYGAAEATLAQAAHEVPPGCGPGVLPVGRPLPGIQIGLRRDDTGDGPPADGGEIEVRSAFLSHGYLSPDHRHHRDGTVVHRPLGSYRTGDRGYVDDAGLLHVVGRLDREVKIRGVRANPDEVAAVLAEHPAIESAAVVVGTDRLGGPQFEAHVVVNLGRAPSAGELRRHVAARLPEPVVPAVYHVHTDLPRSTTGKVASRVLGTGGEGPDGRSPPDRGRP